MKRNRKLFLIVIIIIIVIAGLLDLKYEGLFYQMLPEAVQEFINDIFSR